MAEHDNAPDPSILAHAMTCRCLPVTRRQHLTPSISSWSRACRVRIGALLPRATWLAAALLCTAAGSACPGGRRPAGSTVLSRRSKAKEPIDARFRSLSGQTVSLSNFRGKPLVILFFTTWCVPCQVVVARLQRVRAALGNDRIAVLGVAIDTERRLVPPFVEAAGLNFPVVYGSPGLVRRGPFGAIRSVPRLLVLDPRGRLVADEQLPPTQRRLLELLRPLVHT